MPPNLFLIRGARQLITLRGKNSARRGAQMSDLCIIPDGAVLIRDGRIEDVGPTRRIEKLKTARDAVEIDATGTVVMPGFVDSGAEPGCIPTQGKRAALEASAEGILAGMARHGTLTAEMLTGGGGEMRTMRLHASLQGRPITLLTSLVISGYVSEGFEGTAEDWTRLMSIPLMETAARMRLATSATAMLGQRGTDVAEARLFLNAARCAGLHTKIFTEPDFSEAAASLAIETGAMAVNGLEGRLQGWSRKLAGSSTVLAMAPAVTYLQGRDNFAPARALIDAGAALALATNFSREGNCNFNMLHSMSIACRFTGMSPAEAIVAATLNAAYASGCADRNGSIEPGKSADLILFDCAECSELVRSAAVHQVVRVIRRGQTIYRRGRVGDSE